MNFDLSKYEIVETGDWHNPPPITLMDDLNGFFKMLDSVSDNKLLKWYIVQNIDHRTFQVRKGHYIGFFVHGKLFAHYMRDFDSVEDYLEAKPKAIHSPDVLAKDRKARKNNWPDYKTAKSVWGYIRDSRLSDQERFEQKRKELFTQIDETAPSEPHYNLMPPFNEHCQDVLDWKLWFYAHLNGWKSFSELLDFAQKVFSNLQTIIKDAHWKYIYLAFLALYGPFKDETAWLQGWPSFQTIIDFWNAKLTRSDTKNRLQKATWGNHIEKMKEITKEIFPIFKYPSIPIYDSECKNGFDWVIWTIAQKNDWSNYKQLLYVLSSKDPSISQKVSDKLLYEFAIRTPKEVKAIEVMVPKDKRQLFFNIKGKLTEIKFDGGLQ